MAASSVWLGLPQPGHAGEWDGCGVGSWVRVEWRTSGAGVPRVYQVTTTLKKTRDGDLWFEHRNTLGQRFEDGLVKDDDFLWGKSPSTRDTALGFENVTVGGRSYRCRVVMTERQGAPWCGNDPVSHWIERTWRWSAEDTSLPVRELKRVWSGRTYYYEDGHVRRTDDSTTWRVVRMNQVVRVNGQSLDCTVTTLAPTLLGGSPEGRLTTWECDRVPTGWVRRRHVGRDPRTERMVVTETRLIDYGVR